MQTKFDRLAGDEPVEKSTVDGGNNTVPEPHDIAAQLRRRRAASYRLPPLACGRRDPLDPPASR